MAAKPDRDDVLPVAWYHFPNTTSQVALTWFETAMKLEPDTKVAAGGILASVSEIVGFLKPPLTSDDHQIRGWCLMNAKRHAEAEVSFAAAVAKGEKQRGVAAYGQALAALRAGRTNTALGVVDNARLTVEQRRTIDVEAWTQRSRSAFAARDYASAVRALDNRRRLQPETRDLTLMRGWANYHGGSMRNALDVFSALDERLSTHETRRGLHAARKALRGRTSYDG